MAPSRTRVGSVSVVVATLLGAGLAGPACGEQPEESIGATQQAIVYGTDDRIEYGAITDANLLRVANATAALFNVSKVSCGGSSCDLDTNPFTQIIGQDHQCGFPPQPCPLPLCEGTAFEGQEQGAHCTAFLVGPDLIATAGHCMDDNGDGALTCGTYRKVVFGFTADEDGENEVTTVPASDVYTCVGTPIGVHTGSEDWAVFKVDRPVSGRIPLMLRRSGSPSANELGLLGHFSALPLKISTEGELVSSDSTNFEAKFDAGTGNSGGPVIELATGVVQGIMARGPKNPGTGNSYLKIGTFEGLCYTEISCSATGGCDDSFYLARWPEATDMAWVAAPERGNVPLHAALLGASVL
jgi:hypothetical protein